LLPWDTSIVEKELSRKVLCSVPRQEVEELRNCQKSLKDGKVVFVTGPKGCGKSLVVSQAFYRKPGIVYCLVSRNIDKELITRHLLEATGIGSEMQGPLLTKIHKILNDLQIPGGFPVIIVEFERDCSREVLLEFYKLLKSLSSVARGIIVTDPYNITGINFDQDRVRTVWVSDFTREQAKYYFEATNIAHKMKQEMTPGEKELYLDTNAFDLFYERTLSTIFDSIGTRPLTLHSLMTGKMAIREFIESHQRNAKNRIINLLIDHPEISPILRDLLTSEVLTQEHVTRTLGLSLRNLASIIEDYQVIDFNIHSEVFVFHSTAIKNAANDLLTQQ